jgi:SynChlorMet cassette radical SAM/SPASM protein ScmF
MNFPVDNKVNEEPTLLKRSQIELPEGVPPLTSLYMYISGSCNLACRHCWITPNYVPNGKGGQFLKLEHIQKAVSEALPLGLTSVKLTGGEPTLHPQFRELVSIVDQAGVVITMETNGILIDASLARFMKDTSNFKFLSVSLDGADATTHESLRMVPGCFGEAINGIRNLVEVGLSPQIICTLHQGNRTQVSAMVRLANDLGCNSVKFNHIQPNGRGLGMAETEGLSIPELIDIFTLIENQLVFSSPIPIYFDIPLAFRLPKTLLRIGMHQCNILNILGLLSGGDLSLCGIGVTVPELIYGNIAKNSLIDIWYTSNGLRKLRQLIPSELKGICDRCIHKRICMGTCVAANFSISGSLNSPYYFCSQAEQNNLFPKSRLIYQ